MTMRSTIWIMLGLVLLPALLHAQELFKDAAPMTMPFPPGERSIARLFQFGNEVVGVIGVDGVDADFIRCDPAAGTVEKIEAPLPLPAAYLAIAANPDRPLVADLPRRCGYSLADNGKLVKLDMTGALTEIGQVAGTRPFEGKTGYQLSRVIVTGADGMLYTAGANGAIFRYDPAANKLEKLKAVLPAVKGREAWASLDAAAVAPDGTIYGGTFDGYLFTFDPKTLQVVNLGKPFRAQRIQGLAFRQGKLVGVGGDEQSVPRAFAFDPKTRGFEVGGTLPSGYEPIGALLALPDGTIYFSTTGRLGNLYLWK